MNYWAYEILNTIKNDVNSNHYRGFKICTVKTVEPLIFTFEGNDIGTKEEDTVYIHPLFLPPLIELEENVLLELQTFNNSSAYNSPAFSAQIEGSIPNFIKEFYLFFKNWQQTYVLAPGDKVIVYELGDNKYFVIQKVVQDVLKEKNNEL